MDVKDSLLSGVSLYNSLTSKGLFLCFIGLLCKKRKGKDTYGIWSITQKVFVIDGITIDNKSISTEFSKIKKDRKPYIYFKKLIEKAVD